VVEATSGNTGIALAMVCAAKGYPFVAVMVETFSIERRRIMRMLGAKVILTPAAGRGQVMVAKAAELAQKHGWFLARQFENPANPAYHRNTTGPEIIQDFVGKRLDHFVTGWGTGGTLTGAGEVLKLARPDIKVIVCEPEAAQLLGGKPFAPHKIQGWTPDFVPAVLNRSVADRIVPVADAEAIETSRALAKNEGIFVGISSGATFAAASRWRAKPDRVRSRSPCCLTPANVIYLPRCSRESRTVVIPSHERTTARSIRPCRIERDQSRGCCRACRSEPGSRHEVRRAARPLPVLARRRTLGRPRRLRDMGFAQCGARQRDTVVHRTLTVGARCVVSGGSLSWLVGKDGRPRQGHRHKSLLRRLRQLAG
jgi:cysteine synthase